MDILRDVKFLRPPCRAVWTEPASGEAGAPSRRIIHSRYFSFANPVRLLRLGLTLGTGYFKCGGEPQHDWVKAFRILAWQDGQWTILFEADKISRPEEESPRWYDLPGLEITSLLVEARRSGVDEWWTSWNLAMTGFVLETSPVDYLPCEDRLLQTGQVELSPLPAGLTAERRGSEVRYRSRHLEVGFRLNHASFSHFSFDDTGQGKTGRNLLQLKAYFLFTDSHSVPHLTQGLQLHPVGGDPLAGYFHFDGEGSARVEGNRVSYDVAFSIGQHYHLEWTVEPAGLILKARRKGSRPLRAWNSSVWQMAFTSETTATTALGKITREGETGLMALPMMVHSPGFGSLQVSSEGNGLLWRFDSIRPMHTTTGEIKLGEVAQPEGDYLLLPGEHAAEIRCDLVRPEVHVAADTPAAVREALVRCTHTSLPYRPDAGTLSNNGNSIHCTFCMDGWAELAAQIGRLLPGFSAGELVEQSLTRWLTGGPSYACGGKADSTQRFEDEYLHTSAGAFLGLALHLENQGKPEWLEQFSSDIARELQRLRARDLDQDGLIESAIRRGISGEYQWSTNWWDVISFGWKDAFVNALLYRALRLLEKCLPRLGRPDLAEGLPEWAGRLKDSYHRTFFNPATGWVAGWVSPDKALHDYGFLFVNGAAVNAGLLDPALARGAMEALWQELRRLPISLRDGIPGNLRAVPDQDMADPHHHTPQGCYENGGLTLSHSHHFLAALYRVGMMREGDDLLNELCSGLADCSAFGGCDTGVDWRRWSGLPCGYEGLLCDQFPLLAVAMERYSARPGEKCADGVVAVLP